PSELSDLAVLYEPGANTPLWVDRAGRPTLNARDAMTLIADAATEGLDPGDYSSPRLAALAATLDGVGPSSTADIAEFDVLMSVGMLRYLRHLHLGRIDPRAIGFKLDVPADDHDFVTLLSSALRDQRIVEAASELAPPLVQYRLLRAMLARYRTLAADTSLAAVPPAAATVRPGEAYDGLEILRR